MPNRSTRPDAAAAGDDSNDATGSAPRPGPRPVSTKPTSYRWDPRRDKRSALAASKWAGVLLQRHATVAAVRRDSAEQRQCEPAHGDRSQILRVGSGQILDTLGRRLLNVCRSDSAESADGAPFSRVDLGRPPDGAQTATD